MRAPIRPSRDGSKKERNDAAECGASGRFALGLIDARIAELGDWRGATLAAARALVRAAAPDAIEAWKWRGVPVWEDHGMLCTGETYRAVVKLTFAHGAALDDPAGLFNASLDGNVRRAIDVREGEALDPAAFGALVRAAVARNRAAKARPTAKSRAGARAAS